LLAELGFEVVEEVTDLGDDAFLLRHARTHFCGVTLAYQQVASMIPETIPVILESIVSAEFIDDEVEAAHEALATDGRESRFALAALRSESARSSP
jgi:hypothetical protein